MWFLLCLIHLCFSSFSWVWWVCLCMHACLCVGAHTYQGLRLITWILSHLTQGLWMLKRHWAGRWGITNCSWEEYMEHAWDRGASFMAFSPFARIQPQGPAERMENVVWFTSRTKGKGLATKYPLCAILSFAAELFYFVDFLSWSHRCSLQCKIQEDPPPVIFLL